MESRVVVGFVDSGCGEHPWLRDVVRDQAGLTGTPIGLGGGKGSLEEHPDQTGALDGMLDAVAGHGTFIAGVVRQVAPTATVHSWRAVGSDGAIDESALVAALQAIADAVHAERQEQGSGLVLDVLSLSLGFYPERPDDPAAGAILRPVLHELSADGVTIVCSAGNESTDRPLHPAALAAEQAPGAPILSVGARNPNGSVALFSNTGDWVSCYVAGAAVVSTSPPFDGGLQPVARTTTPGGTTTQTLDPDDYAGGFAVWSGTSFAAPHVAGLIARELAELRGGAPGPAEASEAAGLAGKAWSGVLDRIGG